MKTIAPFPLFARVLLLAMPLGVGACSSMGSAGFPVASTAVEAEAPPPQTVAQAAVSEVVPEAVPADTDDDLAQGKRQFAATNYGLAEQHFRRAVEKSTGPRSRDAEAWMGLAASYDRLRRFDLADRAYRQALRAMGPTPEILNNQGYSFMLRRDFKRARSTLAMAQRKDPTNVYIRNNLALLDENETGRPVR
jgi:Flp pilus assembly protein TadD